MLDSTNVPLSTTATLSYAAGASKGSLFGHPIVEASALEGLLDRLDGTERTDLIPKDLVNRHFSTSGHFPACLGRVGDDGPYLFSVRGHDGDRYHVLVGMELLAQRPKFFCKDMPSANL